jgi:hypothetical protein
VVIDGGIPARVERGVETFDLADVEEVVLDMALDEVADAGFDGGTEPLDILAQEQAVADGNCVVNACLPPVVQWMQAFSFCLFRLFIRRSVWWPEEPVP